MSKPKLDHILPALRALAVPIGQLHYDPDNVRKHDVRNLDAIAASLQRFGQQAPVVYAVRRRQKIVLKGNGLLAAAKQLGWRHVAAVETGLAEQEAKAFAIADNRTSDLSEFDERLLAAQLQELSEAAEVDLEAMGFDEEELQELIASVERAADVDQAEPAPAAEPRKRGERVAAFIIGHLKFEMPRKDYDRWIGGLEAKVGPDPDRLVREIRRRLKL